MEAFANVLGLACLIVLLIQFAYDARFAIRARFKAELRARNRRIRARMLQTRNIANLN